MCFKAAKKHIRPVRAKWGQTRESSFCWSCLFILNWKNRKWCPCIWKLPCSPSEQFGPLGHWDEQLVFLVRFCPTACHTNIPTLLDIWTLDKFLPRTKSPLCSLGLTFLNWGSRKKNSNVVKVPAVSNHCWHLSLQDSWEIGCCDNYTFTWSNLARATHSAAKFIILRLFYLNATFKA